jgi:hypothetical protein
MKTRIAVAFLSVILFHIPAHAQAPKQKDPLAEATANMPSTQEMMEILAKADEKVTSFEIAMKSAKPRLDKLNPTAASNYLDAAATAHELIATSKKNTPSAYSLVALLITLDDLTIDATKATLFLTASYNAEAMQGKQPNGDLLASLGTLTAAGTACNDIAELLGHMTLRYINAEEQILTVLIPKDK